jgi:hypothetical protein
MFALMACFQGFVAAGQAYTASDLTKEHRSIQIKIKLITLVIFEWFSIEKYGCGSKMS